MTCLGKGSGAILPSSNEKAPLPQGTGMDHDGQDDECVDSDLPFSGLYDDSLVEEMRDITQQQGKHTI